MKIKMIACMNNSCSIGKDNKLLWHSKEDMKYFKNKTKGNAILMGRKTRESLPIYPLPDRLNLTLTSNPRLLYDVSSIDDAINMCYGYETLWIIGGQSLYEQYLDIVDEVHLSCINDDQDGDKHFPYIKMLDKFREKEPIEVHNNLVIMRYNITSYFPM